MRLESIDGRRLDSNEENEDKDAGDDQAVKGTNEESDISKPY